MEKPDRAVDSMGLALRLVDDAWDELRRSPFVQQQLGAVPSRLPDLSLAEAQRKSAVGRALLARAELIDADGLPHDLALSVELVRFRAGTWAREADWYWTVTDPLGVGFFGLFLPTAYCGGFLLNSLRPVFQGYRFSEPGDFDRYLALVADYARLIEQMRERTGGQAERGLLMPRVQVEQARALVQGFRAQARATLSVSEPRLGALDGRQFLAELDRRVAADVEPAFDRLLRLFDDAYLARAPQAVGIGQYPGGGALYAALVRLHTTLDLTPEQVHQAGLDRMAGIQAGMQAIRDELGFAGDGAAFLAALAADPRWRADTTAGVAAFFERYMARMNRRFGEYFHAGARASHGVEPLPAALQGSMTFGYYDAPRPDRARGLFLFNSANLTRQPLFNVASLNYHELVPGHHLHLATQQENPTLHPFRTYSFVNAYNEGWAEYAATLAGEMGMYEEPEERYGRLVMDAFLTCRLVVDTGMNVLGWTLEQAREYMRKYSGMSEAEIRSETVRYSCDIPGQSLAYKLGDTRILEIRERVRARLGERFDIRDFHAAVLGPGGLPLGLLAEHVDRQLPGPAAH